MTTCQGLGGKGTKYTYAQLEGLWINNGGPAAVAPIAAAIALAESGGCSTALNPTDNNGTQSSFGLWQVSNGTHVPPVNNIYDPNVNARNAVAKYQGGGGFSPWGTFNSGAYKAFLNGSTTPDTSVPGGSYSNPTADQAAAQAGKNCAWSIGGQHIGLLFGHGPTLPSTCVVTKTEIRAFLGAWILGAGFVLALPGAVIVLAYGFRASGAAAAVTQVISVIPAGRAASAGTKAAGGSAARATPRTAREPSARSQQRRVVRGYNASQQQREVHHEPKRQRRKPDLGELREVPETGDNG